MVNPDAAIALAEGTGGVTLSTSAFLCAQDPDCETELDRSDAVSRKFYAAEAKKWQTKFPDSEYTLPQQLAKIAEELTRSAKENRVGSLVLRRVELDLTSANVEVSAGSEMVADLKALTEKALQGGQHCLQLLHACLVCLSSARNKIISPQASWLCVPPGSVSKTELELVAKDQTALHHCLDANCRRQKMEAMVLTEEGQEVQ